MNFVNKDFAGARVRRSHWMPAACLAVCAPYDFVRKTRSFTMGVDQLWAAFTAGYPNLAADLTLRRLSLYEARAMPRKGGS